MSLLTLVTLILVAGIVWGGFALLLIRAIRSGRDRTG